MRRSLLVLVALALAVAFPSVAFGAEDPAPVPELPEPLVEVVAVLEPTVTPVCGTTAIVGFLGPAVLASAPQEIRDLVTQTGPALVILCGAVPVDTGGYRCDLDGDLAALVAEQVGSVDASVTTILLIALPEPVRAVMNQTRNVLDLVPGAEPVEPSVAAVLQCQEPEAEPPLPDFDLPATDSPVATTPPPVDGPTLLLFPPPGMPTVPPAPTVAPLPNSTEIAAPSPTVTAAPIVTTHGFQYAAVLLLPFLLIVGSAYVGSALTGDLEPRRNDQKKE